MSYAAPNQVIDARMAIVDGTAQALSGCPKALGCSRASHCLRANALLHKQPIPAATASGDCPAFIFEEKIRFSWEGRMQVIYSPNEAATMGGRGFWNTQHGWVDLEDATRFTREQAEHYALPMSLGQDRQWLDDPTPHILQSA
ncbi:MAG: Uncharacterized protein AWU57_564 [Marinobacter sp. T13-3]|mgnify:CR=1 FL=1|nr:MAG: Uncharacterized protein AWU57_564 [Marinobacter sp. T13-3]